MSHRYVALLRAVNLGRHRRIAMADLRAAVESLGHRDVGTLLQSGNVVFTATGVEDARRPDQLATGIEEAIRGELGLDVDVVVRSGAELTAVAEHDPLRAIAADDSRYHVLFLRHAPDATALAAIDRAAYEPEVFAARGRELYVWMPEGVRNARLTAALGRVGPPEQVVTARNWNTVRKLRDLL